MTEEFALQLSTTLKPPTKFTVDGQSYDLLGIDHLSPEQEAEAMALFARLGIVTDELNAESNVQKGTKKAAEVRATRVAIFTKLTTLPKEVASKLPLSAQVALLERVQEEMTETVEETGMPEEPLTPGAEAAQARADAEAAERAAAG